MKRHSGERRSRERLFGFVTHSRPEKSITEVNNNVTNSISKYSGGKYILCNFIIIINVRTDLIKFLNRPDVEIFLHHHHHHYRCRRRQCSPGRSVFLPNRLTPPPPP